MKKIKGSTTIEKVSLVVLSIFLVALTVSFVGNRFQEVSQTKNAVFITTDGNYATIVDGEVVIVDFENESSFSIRGAWENFVGGIRSAWGFLFAEHGFENYEVHLNAQLSEGTGGGFGLVLDGFTENEDLTGVVLQFDRGYAEGAIIARRWAGGSEMLHETPLILIDARHDERIPTVSENPDFWNGEKEMIVTVENIGGNNYVVSMVLDGTLIFNDFYFESQGGDVRATGVRSWHSEVEFYNLSIREID